MVELLDAYQAGNIDFFRLVGELEGALDAGEFQNSDFTKQWYQLWTPLEVTRAVKGSDVRYEEVASDLNALRRFLADQF